jgi:hypothetical protein
MVLKWIIQLFYAEWLYASEIGKEAKLFYRDIEEDSYINPNKFKEGMKFFDKKNSKIDISKNQLFIWKCDQNDGEVAKRWWRDLCLFS